MSWTNDMTLEFIDLYRREPLLWDPKHPEHRNRGEVSLAWMRIQSALSINCTVTDLKKKKESLMTSFRVHWKRKRKIPNYRSTWFAYPRMESFLCNKYGSDTNELENEFFDSTETYTPPDVDPISCRNISATDKSNAAVRKSRIKSYSSKKSFRSAPNETTVYIKDPKDDNRNLDEYDLYGQLLATKLRKLDEHQRDVAMHEIDNIMFRAKIQTGTTESSNYHSPPSPRKMKSPLFIVTQPTHTQYEDENISYAEHSMNPQQTS